MCVLSLGSIWEACGGYTCMKGELLKQQQKQKFLWFQMRSNKSWAESWSPAWPGNNPPAEVVATRPCKCHTFTFIRIPLTPCIHLQGASGQRSVPQISDGQRPVCFHLHAGQSGQDQECHHRLGPHYWGPEMWVCVCLCRLRNIDSSLNVVFYYQKNVDICWCESRQTRNKIS